MDTPYTLRKCDEHGVLIEGPSGTSRYVEFGDAFRLDYEPTRLLNGMKADLVSVRASIDGLITYIEDLS